MATKGSSFQFFYNAWSIPKGLLPSMYTATGWRMYLSSVAYDTVISSQNANPPNSSLFTEASPTTGNYPAGGTVLTTLAKVAADAAADGIAEVAVDPGVHTGNVIEIPNNANNPTDARTAIFVDSASTGPLCILAVELTDDNGVTPVDMVNAPLRVTPDVGGTPGRIYYNDTT